MKTTIVNKALRYLKSQFKIIENIPDVNNKLYDAVPLFIRHDKPIKDMLSNEVRFPDFVLTYRSYSPTNEAGKLKQGYYSIIYNIELIKN